MGEQVRSGEALVDARRPLQAHEGEARSASSSAADSPDQEREPAADALGGSALQAFETAHEKRSAER